MGKTAIILGATGLTGSCVLEQLLEHPDYSSIKLFSRRSCGIDHPKVNEFIGDLLNLEDFKEDFTGDEVYVCIGTTKKKTPDKEVYRRIDFGIPVMSASLAKENGIDAIAVISAIGANSESSFEYNRIKGDMEKAVMDMHITHTYLLRPSIIGGNRKEKRAGEKVGLCVFKTLQPLMIGKLKKYRVVDAKDIAAKMIALMQTRERSQIVESDDI